MSRWARFHGTTDANHSEVMAALRKLGCSVEDCSAIGRRGVPDLLCGLAGVTFLVEIKTTTGELSGDQVDWHRAWKGALVFTIRTAEECATLCKRIRLIAMLWAKALSDLGSDLVVSPVAAVGKPAVRVAGRRAKRASPTSSSSPSSGASPLARRPPAPR
jgi:hypothetical protein